MLDMKTIRDRPDDVAGALKNRNYDLELLDNVLSLDLERRQLLQDVEALKNERNVASKEIGRLKKSGADTSSRQRGMREVGERIQNLEQRVREVEDKLQPAMLRIPNLPHVSVPVGPDASGNQVVRTWGVPRVFDFPPQPHWDIGVRLGMLEFERATRMAGSGFPFYRGAGARLERALINFMLDVHTREHGYEEVSPPFLCNPAAMTGTGQLPRMAEDMYYLPTEDLYLIPTAEVPITNLYREEIIGAPLPLYFVGYSPCFRREAGAAGRETRGLNRIHQFDKVELVKLVAPGTAYDELEKLVRDAETVLQRLELPYRVLQLCTGDLSFAAAKCYDIELWAPGQQLWLEVSSCSTFEDFQARRAQIRYRTPDGKTALVHTLNGSGVALPRLVVALIENGQQADGSVVIPAALRPYMNGMERITPPVPPA